MTGTAPYKAIPLSNSKLAVSKLYKRYGSPFKVDFNANESACSGIPLFRKTKHTKNYEIVTKLRGKLVTKENLSLWKRKI